MTGEQNPVSFNISEDWSGAIRLNELLPMPLERSVPFVQPARAVVAPQAPVCFTEEIESVSDRLDTQEALLDEDPSLISASVGQVYGWDDLDDPSSFTDTVASAEPPDGAVLRDLLEPSRSIPMAELVTLKGHPISRFKVNRGGLTFGRSEDRDVVLLQRTASRKHAEIRWDAGSFVIVDLGSSNGVHVNERRVAEAILEHGDTVEIGDAVFTWSQALGSPRLDEATQTAGELTEPWEELLDEPQVRSLHTAFSAPVPEPFIAPPQSPVFAAPPPILAPIPDGALGPAPANDGWGLPPAVGTVPEGPTRVQQRPPLPTAFEHSGALEFQLAGPREPAAWLKPLAVVLMVVALAGVASLGYRAADHILSPPTVVVGDPAAYARYMEQGATALRSGDYAQAALDFGLADQAQPGSPDAERMSRYAQEFAVIAMLDDTTGALAAAAAVTAESRKAVLDRAAVAAQGRSRSQLRDVMAQVDAMIVESGEDAELMAAQDELRARLAYLGPAPRRETQAQKDAKAALERCEQAVANRDHRTAYKCLSRIVQADRTATLPGGQRASAALAATVEHLETRAKPYYQRGVADQAAGRHASARDAFEAALRIYPQHEPSMRALADTQVSLEQAASEHMTRARVYEQAHRVDKALVEYHAAIKLAGKDSRAGRLATQRIAELMRED